MTKKPPIVEPYLPTEEEIYRLAKEIRTKGYVDEKGVRYPPHKEFRRDDLDEFESDDEHKDG